MFNIKSNVIKLYTSRYTERETDNRTMSALNKISKKKNAQFLYKKDSPLSWCMCFVAFLCVMIQASVDYNFGLIIVPLMNDFNSDRSLVSWIGSIENGMLYISGMAASIGVKQYGLRAVLICGGILGAAAFGTSALSSNVGVMMVTFGLMGGTALGFIYTPSIIACSYYFERRRALATGISLCGK